MTWIFNPFTGKLESSLDETGFVTGVSGPPLTLAAQIIAFSYDVDDFQLSGNSLQIKPHGLLEIDVNGNLMPILAVQSDDYFELDANSNLMPLTA